MALLHLQHLIVDEYQDLNPIDQQFVDELIARGVITFVAGDDDQSIYSFRYGSPAGIQDFTQRYPAAAPHTLTDCFRCAHSIASTANALMVGYPSQNRIPKALNSLYAGAAPAVAGVVHRWRFPNAATESDSIAASCRALINAGVNPRDILILLSNQRELLGGLRNSLNAANVPFEPPRAETFIDSDIGRFVLAIVRLVCDLHDHVAHRLILGLRPGVGTGTCDAIANAVINNALSYWDVFHNPLPGAVFRGRNLTALNHARHVCLQVGGWLRTDTLAARLANTGNLFLYGHAFGAMSHAGIGFARGDLARGLPGLLIRPSRGLLVFSPVFLFVAIGIYLWFRDGRIWRPKIYGICLFATAVHLVVIGSWRGWAGGFNYGPRLLTDVVPCLVILMIPAMSLVARSRSWRLALASAIVVSITVQAIGVFFYPNGHWDALPQPVTTHRERVWDWKDNQIFRSARAGPVLEPYELAYSFLTGSGPAAEQRLKADGIKVW